MHETLKSRVLLAVLCGTALCIAVSGCALKQSNVALDESQASAVSDGVTVEGLKVQAPPPKAAPPPPPPPPPPAPKPVPLPESKPVATAVYAPKPPEPPKPAVVENVEPGTLVARRSYLIPTKAETLFEQFGLCAYVVLPYKYNSEASGIYSRYLQLHRAFKGLPQYRESRAQPGTDETSVLYWNLRRPAFAANAHDIFNKSDSFFVRHYDYDRASAFLGMIRGLNASGGPFIIASRYAFNTLSRSEAPEDQEVLILDLSRVYEDSFLQVMDVFFDKVMRDPRVWKRHFDTGGIDSLLYTIPSAGKASVLKARWSGNGFTVK